MSGRNDDRTNRDGETIRQKGWTEIMIWDKGREECHFLFIFFDMSCAKSNICLMGIHFFFL
jgi:hypothetical protein